MAKKPSNKKQQGKSKTSKGRGKSKSVKGKGKAKGRQSKSKQSSKPKVNKGLNLYIHVRSVLWNQFKGNYNPTDYSTSGSEFLTIAGQVYRECRSNIRDCTDDVIIQKYNAIVGGEIRREPFIGRDLYGQARPYYEIADINWNQFEPYLWIVSPMIIPSPHEFQISDYLGVGGERSRGFRKFFKQWIDFNNDNQQVREEGSEGNIPYFIMSKPKWNEQKKRWEVSIHIVTAGSELDRLDDMGQPMEGWEGWTTATYGFTPKGKVTEPKLGKTIKPPSEKKKEEKKEAPKETETQKRLREAQIKEVESKTAKHKVEALREKKKSYLDELKTYKELGMEKEAENILKKIQITNLQINKATK